MLHGWISSCMYISSQIQVKPLHPPFSHGLQYMYRSHCSPVPRAGASLSCLPHPCLGNNRKLTPVRWLPLVKFGRGQTHKHVDKTSLIPGGTEAPGSGDCVMAQPFPPVLPHLCSPAVQGFGTHWWYSAWLSS